MVEMPLLSEDWAFIVQCPTCITIVLSAGRCASHTLKLQHCQQLCTSTAESKKISVASTMSLLLCKDESGMQHPQEIHDSACVAQEGHFCATNSVCCTAGAVPGVESHPSCETPARLRAC